MREQNLTISATRHAAHAYGIRLAVHAAAQLHDDGLFVCMCRRVPHRQGHAEG